MQLDSSGVYAEDEKKFVFNNVIVGRKAVARFKISNNQKVPCDVVFTVKPVVAKGTARQQEIFEIEPARAQIMNHSHVYATVTFTPPSMQVQVYFEIFLYKHLCKNIVTIFSFFFKQFKFVLLLVVLLKHVFLVYI